MKIVKGRYFLNTVEEDDELSGTAAITFRLKPGTQWTEEEFRKYLQEHKGFSEKDAKSIMTGIEGVIEITDCYRKISLDIDAECYDLTKDGDMPFERAFMNALNKVRLIKESCEEIERGLIENKQECLNNRQLFKDYEKYKQDVREKEAGSIRD